MVRSPFLAGAAVPCLLLPVPAGARTCDPALPGRSGAAILVTGQRDPLGLRDRAQANSRPDLTIRKTPASVEVLTQDDLQRRGLRTAREAFDGVVGAAAGNIPGHPAVVRLRGFTSNTVSILQDGVRISTSTVVQRDINTWHHDRVAVIKGPASVLHGKGALAGVIDKVTRSYLRSDRVHDVDDNATFSAGLTGSMLWRPSDRIALLVAVDHFEDRYTAPYQGLPLIPRQYALRPTDAVRTANDPVADRALRRRNTNPQGPCSGADETTARSRLDWSPGQAWTIALDLVGYSADRAFLNLTPAWLLVGEARWDHIALDRVTIENVTGPNVTGQNVTGAHDRNSPAFDPASWRAGTIWEALPGTTVCAQHTTAVSPVSSILLASIGNTRFRLTTGHAIEAGFKATGWGGRVSVTGAVYRIEQSDILTRDPNDPAVTMHRGRQSSQGFELSAVFAPVPALRLSGGVSCTDARYDALSELVGGVHVDRGGNRPINVPSITANASAFYTFADRITLGALAVFDASVAFALARPVTVTVRGRNLADAFHGEHSGYRSANVCIGAPRSFEIALATRF